MGGSERLRSDDLRFGVEHVDHGGVYGGAKVVGDEDGWERRGGLYTWRSTDSHTQSRQNLLEPLRLDDVITVLPLRPVVFQTPLSPASPLHYSDCHGSPVLLATSPSWPKGLEGNRSVLLRREETKAISMAFVSNTSPPVSRLPYARQFSR